jgi:hypothetical protein
MDDFIAALATRYKGRIKYYEMANESDTYTTASDFVTYVNRVVPIIRRIDPAARIISPSMHGRNPTIIKEYLAAGGTTDFDIVSLHSYPPRGNPYNVPETIDLNWVITGNVHLLAPLLSMLERYGLGKKAIWSTEGSWGNNTYATGAADNQDLEAAFVARYHLLHWSNGITRTYWYAWPAEGTRWGTLQGRKGAKAYREVQKWMIGATMTSKCAAAGTVWSCPLTASQSAEHHARAVWDTAGASVYHVAEEFQFYRDLDGNEFKIPANRQITIGLAPVLLTDAAR